MPFLNGVVTYARFAVTGDAPTVIDQSLLDAFAANPARPTPVGVPPGPEAGWTAGRHILDESFGYERMCFGEWIHAAMRLDVVRVPPEVRRAYVAIAESARVSAMEDVAQSGLTRAARKEARAEAQQQWEKEIGKGRYRSSKLVPILWNPGKRVLLAPATTDSVAAPLHELFTATFGGRIEHRSSGGFALDILARRGLTSSFEDAKPDALGQAPSGGVRVCPMFRGRAPGTRQRTSWGMCSCCGFGGVVKRGMAWSTCLVAVRSHLRWIERSKANALGV